jgi:hypothetical protein
MDPFALELKQSNLACWYKYKLAAQQGRTDIYALVFPDDRFKFYSGSHIDPREFFGGLTKEYSEIPRDYADVILQRIFESGANEIHTYGRVECQIPKDWHKYLVQKLIDANIRVYDHATTTLEHPCLFGYRRDSNGKLIACGSDE